MKKLMAVAATAAAVVVGGLPFATAAQAAQVPTRFLQSVTLRAKPTTSSTALGVIPKGTVLSMTDIGYVFGGTYTACGATENVWYPATWHGVKGWVVAACET
ncbi:SH3 domain-containing protein [Streptomyces sp. NPDC047022]|uniref:SH3 domain-containing protein n=1 Tax=Streptomyces sp. NPDC047022 TaxID=3155737 RepID=UPI0033C82941